MRAGRREGVGPRLSPNGHVKNVLALLSLPPREGGRKARGPHSFSPTRVSDSGLSGSPEGVGGVVCVCSSFRPRLRYVRACSAFGSAGADGHLPAVRSSLKPCGAEVSLL